VAKQALSLHLDLGRSRSVDRSVWSPFRPPPCGSWPRGPWVPCDLPAPLAHALFAFGHPLGVLPEALGLDDRRFSFRLLRSRLARGFVVTGRAPRAKAVPATGIRSEVPRRLRLPAMATGFHPTSGSSDFERGAPVFCEVSSRKTRPGCDEDRVRMSIRAAPGAAGPDPPTRARRARGRGSCKPPTFRRAGAGDAGRLGRRRCVRPSRHRRRTSVRPGPGRPTRDGT
jgi:hypothetical protein